MLSECLYQCSACGQGYYGGARAAAGTCELCSETGCLTTNQQPVPVRQDVVQAKAEVSLQDTVRRVYEEAISMMAGGMSPPTVRQALVQQGLSEQAAHIVVGNISQARATALRKNGLKAMAVGASFCAIGVLVTMSTYGMAEARGGGSYVVAWGAVVFGALRCINGVARTILAR